LKSYGTTVDTRTMEYSRNMSKYSKHCERKLILRSHNTSFCLMEVVTKAGLTVFQCAGIFCGSIALQVLSKYFSQINRIWEKTLKEPAEYILFRKNNSQILHSFKTFIRTSFFTTLL
jgi:hypothetical protein